MFKKVYIFVDKDDNLKRVNIKSELFVFNSEEAFELEKKYRKLYVECLKNGYEIYCNDKVILSRSDIHRFNKVVEDERKRRNISLYKENEVHPNSKKR